MSSKFDAWLTATLVICAVVAVGIMVRREFFPPAPPSKPEQKTVFIDNWRTHLSAGTRMGPAQAPVQLIEFSDYECPFCANFHKDLKTLRERYPTQLALTYVHYPLPMHRFAKPAARVVECAGRQGRFEAMHERLLKHQNDFGLKPWSDFAREAGVADIAAFEVCAQSTEPVPQIAQGEQLAKALEVKGTPTLIINGWKLARPPKAEDLDGMIQNILAGKGAIQNVHDK